jgi:pyridoxamine 5'-phosphate oxidase
MNIADYRREYTHSGLNRADLDTNPFQQFDRWFTQAIKSEYPDANALTLATVSATGKPSQRTVLLKGYDSKGFVFFTNYDSEKGQNIAENSQVSMLFSWLQVERQIEISGTAIKISNTDSAEYFHSRPESSQLGAWASHQSQSIDSREALTKQLDEVTERFKGKQIPLPENWGGYLVMPNTIEFWQGREGRLHDRFEYTLNDQQWDMQRLQP